MYSVDPSKWRNHYQLTNYERQRKIARSNSKTVKKKLTRRSKNFYVLLTSFIINYFDALYM